MTQTIQQRREGILAIAYQQSYVSVKDMAERLNVSEATVRRDLQGLALEGHLELTHGGAKVTRNSDYSFLSKSMRNIEGKKTIAEMAAGLISHGDQIFLDSGTTCFHMTSFLRSRRSLSIILHSIRIAQELQTPGMNVLLLGGQYRPERMDTIGPMASNSLENLRGYTAFIGTDGISMDFGLSSVDVESAHLLGIALKNAKKAILLADSTKFDQPSLYKIADFSSISTVLTEKMPSSEWCDFFESKNIKIIHPGNFPTDEQKEAMLNQSVQES